jgi:two-component system chemotaxis sensor kinase CheA
MSEEIEDFGAIFKEETYELLTELENSLMELESEPTDIDLIGRVFRALHTIKGSGAMFGFDTVSSFAHEVENIFDLVREGNIKVTKELIGYTLQAKDFIREIIESTDLTEEQINIRNIVLSNLKNYSKNNVLEQNTSNDTQDQEAVVKTNAQNSEKININEHLETTYRIRFAPSEQILKSGTNPAELLSELSALGKNSIVAHIKDIPKLDDIEPDFCYLFWDILITTTQGIDAIKDIFIFLDEKSKVQIDIIDEGDTDDIDYKKLGFILVEKGDLSIDEMKKVLSKQQMFGEILLEKGLTDHEKIESALMEQKHIREIRKARTEQTVAATLRVSSLKVDKLVDLVGELVTTQARLAQISTNIDDTELVSLSEDIERLIWELRDNTMEMRMLPFGSTFGRFKRLVRDLSTNLNKDIELTTLGGETELDKTVIEKLGDPLTHIIRNCIDHGIEEPDKREQNGKPKQGTINLSAFHSGANVIVQISDDGAGLDIAKIKKKAISKGLISADKKLSSKEISALIFEPGFSTAQEVTDVSGRGVGMDVVKKNINQLRGIIDVESKPGKGTVIKLKIPLTLAIIDGLLVSIGKNKFVLPLSTVEECIEIKHSEISMANRRHFVKRRGELIPYINLRSIFNLNDNIPELEQVAITNIDGERVGFVVDKVIGGHQTVIKSLGSIYKNIDGISGATILGDGTIALILDMLKLIKNAKLGKTKDVKKTG